MIKFENLLPKKKVPERFAKAKNPIDDPIEETLNHWKQVSANGLQENKEDSKDSDIDIAA